MTRDYFDNHITPCMTSINKWNSGISFRVSYRVKIDWSEVMLWDQFIIWISPSTSGLYPSLNLPRNTLLTKDQISTAASLMAFSTRINTISSISNLKYQSLDEAMNTLIRASGVDKLCTSEIFYERPNMVEPPSGHPFLQSNGALSWDRNECITSQIDLYTGEVNVVFDPCMIYFCVAEGTLITVNDKLTRQIEKVRLGDSILSVNTKSMTIEKDIVRKIDSVTHKDLIEIEFQDQTKITSTRDHPYYVKDKGWCSVNPSQSLQKFDMAAKQLETGDICLKYINDKLVGCKIVKITPVTGSFKTYNISSLEKNKSYFANGILISTEEDEIRSTLTTDLSGQNKIKKK
jgi:hypothetical protein